MNNRQRAAAILNYQKYDRLPIVHFGYWQETLKKWAGEGHITAEQADAWQDATPVDREIGDKLGFDFNWANCFIPNSELFPAFETRVLKVREDGSKEVLNGNGVIELLKDDVVSIPAEIDHLLKGWEPWRQHYMPKLKFSSDRITKAYVNTGTEFLRYDQGGLEFLKSPESRTEPLSIFCGSLFGRIRNWLGVEGISYLYVDDEALFDEIIRVNAELCYACTETVLKAGGKFDFAHFWEDICFKNGPLVTPSVFAQKVGPFYSKITALVRSYGIEIVSLDCDGLIDALLPIWLENGVNTMFPIEVGTWRAEIRPWRQKYGKSLRGVGGMDKVVFSRDYAAIDAEIERLKPLVELGGYIPCPDHRIAPDAKWENVQYYCEQMRKTFA
jgi:hypothetical protein